MIAATGVPPDERGAWLAGLAMRFEPSVGTRLCEACGKALTPRRAKHARFCSNACKQREQRARDLRGRVVLGVEVDFYALCEALIDSGRLSAEKALDRVRVDDAAAEVLADWIVEIKKRYA